MAQKAAKSTMKVNPKKEFKNLYPPIQIKDVEIKNRIVMAPMNTVMSLDNRGYVNEQILAYYAARAKGGCGLIITECVLGLSWRQVPVHLQPARLQLSVVRARAAGAVGDHPRVRCPYVHSDVDRLRAPGPRP